MLVCTLFKHASICYTGYTMSIAACDSTSPALVSQTVPLQHVHFFSGGALAASLRKNWGIVLVTGSLWL